MNEMKMGKYCKRKKKRLKVQEIELDLLLVAQQG